jgi:hypothetical protein
MRRSMLMAVIGVLATGTGLTSQSIAPETKTLLKRGGLVFYFVQMLYDWAESVDEDSERAFLSLRVLFKLILAGCRACRFVRKCTLASVRA